MSIYKIYLRSIPKGIKPLKNRIYRLIDIKIEKGKIVGVKDGLRILFRTLQQFKSSVGGWMVGWMEGCLSHFMECLQQ